MDGSASDGGAQADYAEAKASKFSFKTKPERRARRRKRDSDDEDAKESHRESRRRKHRHRTARDDAHTTSTRDGEYYDPDHRYRESLFDGIDAEGAPSGVGTDDAFRESLFDALADDEGAAYWEGVYGQPIHVYPDTKSGPDGKLERMSEEEYADYVRGKMWEKSHQHIIEEREVNKKARQRRKEQRAQLDEHLAREDKERDRIRQQMEESLKRGAERKKAKEAAAAWERYTEKWEKLKSIQSIAQETGSKVIDLIPWPVASGRSKHVSAEEVERFLRDSDAWRADAAAMLKAQRVRWHPDKMQQRFGQHIDTDTMRSVTAVFQVIDRLWTERR